MATAVTDKEFDAYYNLVRRFPLRRLQSEQELEQATLLVDELLERENLTAGEREYLDILSDQVGRYEDEQYPIAPATDAEMLRFLMDARALNESQLAHATEIPMNDLTMVLSGQAVLDRDRIGILTRFFQISPAVFSFERQGKGE